MKILMSDEEKLINAFTKSLNIKSSLVKDSLSYQSIPQWDSMAHMLLIAEIDNTFDTMLDTEEILDISSFKKAKEILSNYGAKF